ncbi:MAG: VCBS repeat-containing protein [Mesorhizobium sp.]|nr:MAG: VCBS repeat-containing protein [Mesorhizobium sp.]
MSIKVFQMLLSTLERRRRHCAAWWTCLLAMAVIVGCTKFTASEPVSLSSAALWDGLEFRMQVVDDRSGDVKIVGDIDGDGLFDLVIGGEVKEALVWYRAPGWRPYLIGRPKNQFTTDGALGDIDSDGDLDIVVPDGPEGANLVGFQNPLPSGDPTDGAQWLRREIGEIGGWGKDVKLADFDGDRRLDIATRSQDSVIIFFQNADGSWMGRPLTSRDFGQEGLGIGDIDADGIQDIVVSGAWVKNPGYAQARVDKWESYSIGPAPENFKTVVADIDQDGQPDVLYSSSEDVADIVWYKAKDGNPRGYWKSNKILPLVEKAHTLAVGDLDGDGDPDLMVGQMHTSSDRLIAAVYNIDGRGEMWRVQVIGQGGVHNGVLADLDADGDLDVYGSNWVTNPPVHIWVNALDLPRDRLPLDRWELAASIDTGQQTCTLSTDDVDGDGVTDVACGALAWRNTGGDLAEGWPRAVNARVKNSANDESNGPRLVSPDLAPLSAADLNSDNAPDVIAAGTTGLGGLYILADHGNGRRGLQYISSGSFVAARAVDLDVDGDLDIVALSNGEFPSLCILRNLAISRDRRG